MEDTLGMSRLATIANMKILAVGVVIADIFMY